MLVWAPSDLQTQLSQSCTVGPLLRVSFFPVPSHQYQTHTLKWVPTCVNPCKSPTKVYKTHGISRRVFFRLGGMGFTMIHLPKWMDFSSQKWPAHNLWLGFGWVHRPPNANPRLAASFQSQALVNSSSSDSGWRTRDLDELSMVISVSGWKSFYKEKVQLSTYISLNTQ